MIVLACSNWYKSETMVGIRWIMNRISKRHTLLWRVVDMCTDAFNLNYSVSVMLYYWKEIAHYFLLYKLYA